MKKISVIVPVYNVERYLKRCIESIINQTYKDLEIILVDDGSTDSSGNICDEYKKIDKRISVIHKKNGGLSDARNEGLKVVTGTYIAFVDSDDFLDLDMYEYMQKNIEKENADIVICGTKIDYDNGKIIVKSSKKLEEFDTKRALIELNSFKTFDMSVWNKLYKKSVIDRIMFPVGKKSEDYFVMYRYFDRAQKVVVLPEAKYHYIQRENSISRGKEITYDYIEGSKSQKNFIDQKHPEISYVGNTAYAFSYVATYNRCIKYKVQLSKDKKKMFKNEVKKYLKDICRNSYISKNKKIQACIFAYSLSLYKVIVKTIK